MLGRRFAREEKTLSRAAIISDANITLLIDEAENVYNSCWKTLCCFKQKEIEINVQDLISFQVDLSKVEFKIEKEIINISQHINANRKNEIIKCEYKKKKLQKCLYIGKALGDAFVWIFYINDIDLLEQHQRQKSNGPSPATKGVFAEISFLEKIGRASCGGRVYI